jgi:hypothetical protein
MTDIFGFMLAVFVAWFIGAFGYAYGHDTARKEIIDACVANNPDMANSKIREYCIKQYDELLVVKPKN